MNTYTPLFLEKPEWFAERADGQLQTDSYAYGPMAYLDVTRSEVLAFVKGIFRRLRAAGFEYFKVDFTQEVLECQVFHDRTLPRGAIIRKAFQTIRDAIGKKAYLLSCGAPYESVTGIADAVRITGDIHNFWSHVVMNATGVAARWWMHRKLWNNDPDFLIVRSPETCTRSDLNRAFTPKPFEHGRVRHHLDIA